MLACLLAARFVWQQSVVNHLGSIICKAETPFVNGFGQNG